MVKELDSKELPRSDEVASGPDVCLGRGGVPGGMIVRDNDRVCPVNNRCTVHFPRVNQDRIENPNSHHTVTEDMAPCVEEDDHEGFDVLAEPLLGCNVHAPILGDLSGRLADLPPGWHRAVAKGNHLELGGRRTASNARRGKFYLREFELPPWTLLRRRWGAAFRSVVWSLQGFVPANVGLQIVE